MKYILNQKEYDEYQRLLWRSKLQTEYIHPTITTSQTYIQLKNKQYKQYFEYCVSETWMDFQYPSNRNQTRDWTVDWHEILKKLNTDDNLKVLKKIRKNIWIDWIIPFWYDNEWRIIYANFLHDSVRFEYDWGGYSVSYLCLVPSIK